VVESHPDNIHNDLRLDRPFRGFTEYCDFLDLSTMTKKVPHLEYCSVAAFFMPNALVLICRSCSLVICNSEFILDSPRVGSDVIN